MAKHQHHQHQRQHHHRYHHLRKMDPKRDVAPAALGIARQPTPRLRGKKDGSRAGHSTRRAGHGAPAHASAAGKERWIQRGAHVPQLGRRHGLFPRSRVPTSCRRRHRRYATKTRLPAHPRFWIHLFFSEKNVRGRGASPSALLHLWTRWGTPPLQMHRELKKLGTPIFETLKVGKFEKCSAREQHCTPPQHLVHQAPQSQNFVIGL